MATPVSADFAFEARIRLVRKDGTNEDKILQLETFSKTGKNQAKAFHPMMLKLFSEAFIEGGNVLPSLYVDFGQWSESFTLSCFVDGTPQSMANQLDNLREWIIKNQSISTNTFYLQIISGPATSGSTIEKVHLDARGVPWKLGTGKGYRGILTSIPEYTWPAGKGAVKYKLTFGVGIVLP